MHWLLVVLIFALAAGLRLMASLGDPWLDEVWSWHLARQHEFGWNAVVNKHDNNHILNTLAMCWIGDSQEFLVYRLPAVGFGLGSVAVAFALGRRWVGAWVGGAVTSLLFAVCFFQVVYASEARGYAGMIFFFLLGLLALERALQQSGLWRSLLFAGAVVGGFLSHLGYLHFYAVAGLWSALVLWRRHRNGVAWIRDLTMLHALPVLFLVVLYWLFFRGIERGGAPGVSFTVLLHDISAWVLGLPEYRQQVGVVAMLGGGLIFGLFLQAARQSGEELVSRRWLSVLMLLVPALITTLLSLRQTEALYPRYFTVPLTFVVLLLGRVLAVGIRAGGGRRLAAAGLLVLFVLGNLLHAARLGSVGRGDYSRVLAYLAESGDEKKPALATGPARFRLEMMHHWFVRQETPTSVRFVYPPEMRRRPDFLVFDRQSDSPSLPRTLRTRMGEFRQLLEVDYYGPSGFRWLVFGQQ